MTDKIIEENHPCYCPKCSEEVAEKVSKNIDEAIKSERERIQKWIKENYVDIIVLEDGGKTLDNVYKYLEGDDFEQP